jgi:hypothetical protein
MPLHPKTPKDLMLAPLAAEIDINLQEIRDIPPSEIESELALRLNLDVDLTGSDPEKRASWVLQFAVWNVDMHDWHAEITGDHARLRLSGGSVSLDVGLSAAIHRYIEHGS